MPPRRQRRYRGPGGHAGRTRTSGSLTWLPANGGLINDAAAIGRLTRSAAVPFLIDAGQALGQIPVDVQLLGCDILKSAGRKHLQGPRGTAILYVRRGFLDRLDPAWVDVAAAPWRDDDFVLESSARRFETSEQSLALLCGLAQAVAELKAQDLQRRFSHIQALGQSLRD
jgi:cysteine desulfurase/selenocysteine lyase